MSTIRCHTVPKFYLSYFLAPGSSLFWIYDKKEVSVRQQSPINTTVIGDYYLSSPDSNGMKDTSMEELLSLVEDMAKNIFDKWRQSLNNFSQKDMSAVAMFLSFMHARAPRAVETIKEIIGAGIDYVLDDMKRTSEDKEKLKEAFESFCNSKKDNKTNLTFEKFSDAIANPTKYCKISVNEKSAIGHSFENAELVYHSLMSMHWGLRYTKCDRFFVTSDAPLNIFVPTRDGYAIFGGGLSRIDVQVAFPLSPKICLWITRKYIPQLDRANPDFVREINRRTIHMAKRFVISPFKSNNIQTYVREFASDYNKPKIDATLIKQKLYDSVNTIES